MNEKRRKSWQKRVFSILICLSVSWLVYAGVMNWIVWHFAREISKTRQNLDVIPTDFKETTLEELKGPSIDKFGFSFHVPWKEVEHDQTTGIAAIVKFKAGAVLAIFNPATEVDAAKVMRGTTTQQLRIMTSIFGTQPLSSSYQQPRCMPYLQM